MAPGAKSPPEESLVKAPKLPGASSKLQGEPSWHWGKAIPLKDESLMLEGEPAQRCRSKENYSGPRVSLQGPNMSLHCSGVNLHSGINIVLKN
jgi:hypothetical protein